MRWEVYRTSLAGVRDDYERLHGAVVELTGKVDRLVARGQADPISNADIRVAVQAELRKWLADNPFPDTGVPANLEVTLRDLAIRLQRIEGKLDSQGKELDRQGKLLSGLETEVRDLGIANQRQLQRVERLEQETTSLRTERGQLRFWLERAPKEGTTGTPQPGG